MTDKEFRKLSRSELVDVIYALKKSELKLKSELEAANARLAEREQIVKRSGSIAEAALELNGVFAAAQKAADEYLAQVKSADLSCEERCSRMIAETEAECAAKRAAADAEIRRKWDNFNANVNRVMASREELKSFLNN